MLLPCLQVSLALQRRKVILQSSSRLLKNSIGTELIQPLFQQAFLLAPPQNLDIAAPPEGIAQQFFRPHHTGEDLLCLHRDVLLHSFSQAAAAVAALIRRLLPEVPQQIGPQTASGAAVSHHPVKPLEIPGCDPLLFLRSQLFVFLGVLDHEPCCVHISRRMSRMQSAGEPSRPARPAS